MKRAHRYVLHVAERLDYVGRLEKIVAKLADYRPEQAIDWRSRVELWLSNFKGPRDQRIALDMLDKFRVVSRDKTIEGCEKLLRQAEALAKGKRVLHASHETSGSLLLRALEKDLEVPGNEILRPDDFSNLETHIKRGDIVVFWDRFNGTGAQLRKQIEKYEPIFFDRGLKPGLLCFVYIAGHPVDFELSANIRVLLGVEEVPTVSNEEREMCQRYKQAAGSKDGNTKKYDTGALIAFSDNIPNNVPFIFQATATETWFPLFERKGTRTGGGVPKKRTPKVRA